MAYLPLFRRAFANLDRMQRRRLLDALFGRAAMGLPGRILAPDARRSGRGISRRISAILTARPADE